VDGLFEEIADIGGEWWWKTEKAPTQALRQAYEFEQLLILTRVYRDDDDEHNPADTQRAGPSQAKKAKQEPPPGKQKLIYPKPEDEAFHAHATWSFLFPAAVPEPSAVADRANKVTQMRLVMCVPASVAAAVRAQTRLVASAGQKE
jgi:BCCIP